jgi:hypothetical protein
MEVPCHVVKAKIPRKKLIIPGCHRTGRLAMFARGGRRWEVNVKRLNNSPLFVWSA